MTRIVNISHRKEVYNVVWGNDEKYRSMLRAVIRECEDIAGTQIPGAKGMTIAQGPGWRFQIGVPRDRQQHYIVFERDEDAVFYVLKHGGVIVSEVDEVRDRK